MCKEHVLYLFNNVQLTHFYMREPKKRPKKLTSNDTHIIFFKGTSSGYIMTITVNIGKLLCLATTLLR